MLNQEQEEDLITYESEEEPAAPKKPLCGNNQIPIKYKDPPKVIPTDLFRASTKLGRRVTKKLKSMLINGIAKKGLATDSFGSGIISSSLNIVKNEDIPPSASSIRPSGRSID